MSEHATEYQRRCAVKEEIAKQAFWALHENRVIVHSLLSGLGADWDAPDVLRLIDEARRVWWDSGSVMDHDLRVETTDGRFFAFQVKAPAGVSC